MFNRIHVLQWTAGLLVAIAALAFLAFFSLATETETEIPLSQLVGLAIEGRVQEIRVQETSGGTVSTAQQVRFTALLDDGSEVIGRAEAQDAIRTALVQAGVADVDALLILE